MNQPASTPVVVAPEDGQMHRRDFVAGLTGITVTLGARRIAYCQAPKPSERSWSALNQLLSDYVGTKKLAGAAVAVSVDGPTTYLKAGRIALDANDTFDEDSVCRIYSMTKPVTGLAAMLLVEAGKLRLDQPVGDVIPELQKPQVALDPINGLDARPAKQTMTMRHLQRVALHPDHPQQATVFH